MLIVDRHQMAMRDHVDHSAANRLGRDCMMTSDQVFINPPPRCAPQLSERLLHSQEEITARTHYVTLRAYGEGSRSWQDGCSKTSPFTTGALMEKLDQLTFKDSTLSIERRVLYTLTQSGQQPTTKIDMTTHRTAKLLALTIGLLTDKKLLSEHQVNSLLEQTGS
jgi:hypothetical protein